MSLLDLVAGAHTKVLRPSGGCHNCPRKRINFVPPTIAPGSVLFLGEVPGDSEVEAGEGFVGAAGKLLRSAATEAGVPGPWSFSYTVHCQPPDGNSPKPKDVQCCLSQFVLDEIRGYSIVVLCGSVPLQALFPGAKADHFRGNVAWHPDFPGQRFYTMYHPAQILRNPWHKDTYHKHMIRLARIANGEPEPTWTVLRGDQGLEELRRLVKGSLLSLDFETNRLESWVEGGKIKSLAVTDGAAPVVKTVVTAHEDEPHFQTMMQLVAEYLAKPEKSVLGANIAFDLEWLERECGIRVACQLIHEVQVQWYQAGQYKQVSLKELVSSELDGYRYLIHHPQDMKDVDLLLRYNAEDVVHPVYLMRKSMQIMKPKTRDLVTRVLGPVGLIFQRMSATGLYLRHDYRKAKIDEYTERRRAVITAWKAADPEFIPSEYESGDGLIHYLYKVRGLPVLERTESELPSTDKSVLKQLVRDGHTIVQNVLDMREIDKIQSTYLTAYDKHVWPDQRIRSHYPLTWTDSGRTSSRTPNLQNIPRKKEIRDLFGVAPGHVLLESDLSQMEFRIMVCLAQDENGIAGYLRGDDAHTMTARTIAGVENPTKEQRSLAKPVNFGCLYGASEYMVQSVALDDYGQDWTVEEAREFRTTFMQTYPRIPIFHAASKSRLISNRGWFESVVGHVFHYREWDSRDQGKRDHAFRAALNAEAQGPCAQLCFYIMVIARRLLDQRGFHSVEFVNHVHDSILTDIPDPAWVPDVVATIEEASQQAHNWVKSWFVVPLIMEHAVGESWGSLQEIKAA